MTIPKRMNFRKRPLTPLPHPSENHIAFLFPKSPLKSPIKIQNVEYIFWIKNDTSLWRISENSSVLVPSPVPKMQWQNVFHGMHKIAYACQFPCGQVPEELGWYFLFPWIVWGGRPTPGNRQLCGRQKKHYTLSPKKHKHCRCIK